MKQVDERGVHQTHCCSKHGCKYGEDDCPVVTWEIIQECPCEYCDEEDELYPEITKMRDGLKEIYNLAQFDWDTMPEQGRKDFQRLVSEIADESLKN